MLDKSLVRKMVVVAIVAQLAVLGGMAAKREHILVKGERVYLRTAPIDPRDPFRGDFVRLSYDLNQVHKLAYQGKTNFEDLKRGDLIYAVLTTLDDEVYFASHFTDELPKTPYFIKGRVDTHRVHRSFNRSFIRAKFGIEQYFVQQGKGKQMEKHMGARDDLQIPAEMQIAIGGRGTAVIRDYRWSKLGVQLKVVRESRQEIKTVDESRPLSPKIEVTFQNVSLESYTLAYLPGDCSFSLMEIGPRVTRDSIDAGCDAHPSESVQRKTLAPGETHVFNLDMESPRWRVLNDNQALVHISERNLRQMYRLRFRAPDVDNAWRGFLNTPRFNPSGRID